MATYSKKTWYNKGETIKTSINKDSLNDLENRIEKGFASVIETGVSNNIYYEKYDNGLLKYFGEVSIDVIGINNRSFSKDITLPVPYKDTLYKVLVSSNGKGNNWSVTAVRGRSVSKNTFNIGAYFNGTTGETGSDLGVYFKISGFWK